MASNDNRNTGSVKPTPCPMSLLSVHATAPPPSYDEVMGHTFMTPIGPNQIELPPLSYIDIMPHCLDTGNMQEKMAPQFEKFR